MTGRTIVITGASDGIGAAAAKRLSRSGENVVVVGRSPEKTAAVATDISADHFVADFSELAQVHELAKQLLERYPRIDVLANNAAASWLNARSPSTATRRSFRSTTWPRFSSRRCFWIDSSDPGPAW